MVYFVIILLQIYC